jgi:hypothetical protein
LTKSACGRERMYFCWVGYAWIESIDSIGVSGHANPPYK